MSYLNLHNPGEAAARFMSIDMVAPLPAAHMLVEAGGHLLAERLIHISNWCAQRILLEKEEHQHMSDKPWSTCKRIIDLNAHRTAEMKTCKEGGFRAVDKPDCIKSLRGGTTFVNQFVGRGADGEVHHMHNMPWLLDDSREGSEYAKRIVGRAYSAMMMPGAGVQLLLLDLAYHAWPYLNAYYRACAVKVACDYEFATGISPVSSASKDYLGYLMGDFHGLERRPHLAVLPTHHQSLAGSSTFIPQARRSCVEVLDNWM